MIINSALFGDIEVNEDLFLNFVEGVPGFEELHRFIIVNKEETNPIRWLQSVENGQIVLPIVDPFIIDADYSPDIPDEDIEFLGSPSAADVVVYSVMVIPRDITKATANLCAPIVLNAKTGAARQVILDDKHDSMIKCPAFAGIQSYCKENQSAGTDKKA